MIVAGNATDARYRSATGEGYDGVVLVSVAGHYGTGSLLYNGRAILTAAHLFTPNINNTATVTFQTTAGTQTLSSSSVVLNPNYDTVNDNNDLAIVWLSNPAPITANRYNIYHNTDELAHIMTMVGYGEMGTGNTGASISNTSNSVRMMAQNQFDTDAVTLKSYLGTAMNWTPTAGTQLIADFDNGNNANDAFGRLMNMSGAGLGQSEGLIAPGDSGGPAFINSQLAGVASYTTSLSISSIHPDVDNVSNSSFGEIAAWQRVSNYQQWIDQSLRAQYPNAPTSPAQVQTQVPEGNSGTSYAYFLLQFTGIRTDPAQKLSVDYSTRDGTATAGQDYIAQHGTLVIYPNETQAVVAVEIIGDTVPEPNETFYLDVTNPVGGSFGVGVLTLTAMRTIVNDDGVIA